MELNQFVTAYDDSLSGDTFIDPLGVLVIWSAFGEQIFRKRVNSISNDVRNYTLNLLNHRLIRDVLSDDSLVISSAVQKEVIKKHHINFKHACLVYLENLFTFCMISADGSKGVDLSGILGSTKGSSRFTESNGNPTLMFSHKKESYLLVRQLSLGVSGRYNTPFTEIGFFDQHPDANELWKKTDMIFKGTELGELYKLLKGHLVTLLKKDTPGTPSCQFEELSEELIDYYHRALATSGDVGEATRDFWLEVTGLDKGAAGQLKIELENLYKQPDIKLINIKKSEIFLKAKLGCEDAKEQDEALKLDHILRLEPFLAELDLLFTLTLSSRNQSVQEVKNLWGGQGRDVNTLINAAKEVEKCESLLGVLKSTAERRLKMLLNAAKKPTFEGQLSDFLDYHSKVMISRGQLPWVQIYGEGGQQIRVNTRTRPMPKKEDIGWVNDYYLPQFYNLVKGFSGVPT